MRRAAKILGLLLGAALLPLTALLLGAWILGGTVAGRDAVSRLAEQFSGGTLRMTGLGPLFSERLTLDELQLRDARGAWLTARHIALRWSPRELLAGRVQIGDLKVADLRIERQPLPGPATAAGRAPPPVQILRFTVDTVGLSAALAGTPAVLHLEGALRLRSWEQADARLTLLRLDGEGDYRLTVHADAGRLQAAVTLHEAAHGPLENLLGLPGLGALDATLEVHGARRALRMELALTAGALSAHAAGDLDLPGRAADLAYSLRAPALQPNQALGWEDLDLQGHWRGPWTAPLADGHLRLRGLRLVGGVSVAATSADLSGAAGGIEVRAALAGVRIPGPKPELLAGEPLQLRAELRLDQPQRPLEVTATHPLGTLHARLATAAGWRSSFDARLPDLAPLTALLGEDVRGGATLQGQAIPGAHGLRLDLAAQLRLSGGSAPWVAALGPRASVELAGEWTATAITLERLRVTAATGTLSAAGTALPAPPVSSPRSMPAGIASVDLRWEAHLHDLATLSSDLAGDLDASGRLAGRTDRLSADGQVSSRLSWRGSPRGPLTATLHAEGLPAAPSGTVRARGLLAGAPLDLDLRLRREGKGLRGSLCRAEWRSVHAEGELTTSRNLDPLGGEVRLRVGTLSDLEPLLGVRLQGAMESEVGFAPVAGVIRTRLRLSAHELRFGSVGATLQLHGEGTPHALELRFEAASPAMLGAPAHIAGRLSLDAVARTLRLASASAQVRGKTLRLLAPARVSLADGVTRDGVRLGAGGARLDVDGRLSPQLAARANMRGVDAGLFNAFSPLPVAQVAVAGQATLSGTLTAPGGEARLEVTGLRLAGRTAAALPAVDLQAHARFDGGAVRLDAQLDAGEQSRLNLTGSAPLRADGVLALQVHGALDVEMINALMEARGLRVAGHVAVDGALGGSWSAPQITGRIALTAGSLRDYGRGIELSNITAELSGAEGRLEIRSFKASAASGSISATGSCSPFEPGLPVTLVLSARGAQPINSALFTANLDADLRVTGKALQRLDVAGGVVVHRATIGIPNSLPPDVEVLDVRRRGGPPAGASVALVIGRDVRVHAPREILVQGRGLDAELGGDLHLLGTTDQPLVSGGLDLQRGSFTVAGRRLDFTAGRIGFAGAGLRRKIEPTLDFTAQAALANAIVTLHITGSADAPRFEFTSIPTLPADEIMAQLLFGQNVTQLSALQAAQIGAALATLTGVGDGGLNPLVKIQRTLGLDRLSVGAGSATPAPVGETGGASIQAGRYLSKRIYVQGTQSTTGNSQVEVDVDLTKHLRLQTRLGNGTALIQGTTPENDPGSSIGLSYQFEY